jgi:hypothetical protein
MALGNRDNSKLLRAGALAPVVNARGYCHD